MTDDDRIQDWLLLVQFCQVYRSFADAFMSEIDMHRAQTALLCHLFMRDGVTQTELADQLSVQKATITHMLQRMEENGLITRRRDDEDTRLVRVYLADGGRAKRQEIVDQFLKVDETIYEGIS